MLQGNDIIIISLDEAESLLHAIDYKSTLKRRRELQKLGLLGAVSDLHSIVRSKYEED